MSTYRIADLVPQFLDELQERADCPFCDAGPLSGFGDIDHVMQGFRSGELTVIGGRPAMGKTSIVSNIATHVAIEQELSVLIFLENSPEEMLSRLMATGGDNNLERLRKGNLIDREWTAVSNTAEELRSARLFVRSLTGLACEDMVKEAQQLHKEAGPLGLVLIDSLKLSAVSHGHIEVPHPAQQLKDLAMALQIPVGVTAPLLSSIESRRYKNPRLSDLVDAEAIERDADVILFVFREEYYSGGSAQELGTADIQIARNRCGPTASIKLGFRQSLGPFEDLGNRINSLKRKATGAA